MLYGKSDRPISFSVSFCIWLRSFKLISLPFVWERIMLAAVHSTQLWVLVKSLKAIIKKRYRFLQAPLFDMIANWNSISINESFIYLARQSLCTVLYSSFLHRIEASLRARDMMKVLNPFKIDETLPLKNSSA